MPRALAHATLQTRPERPQAHTLIGSFRNLPQPARTAVLVRGGSYSLFLLLATLGVLRGAPTGLSILWMVGIMGIIVPGLAGLSCILWDRFPCSSTTLSIANGILCIYTAVSLFFFQAYPIELRYVGILILGGWGCYIAAQVWLMDWETLPVWNTPNAEAYTRRMLLVLAISGSLCVFTEFGCAPDRFPTYNFQIHVHVWTMVLNSLVACTLLLLGYVGIHHHRIGMPVGGQLVRLGLLTLATWTSTASLAIGIVMYPVLPDVYGIVASVLGVVSFGLIRFRYAPPSGGNPTLDLGSEGEDQTLQAGLNEDMGAHIFDAQTQSQAQILHVLRESLGQQLVSGTASASARKALAEQVSMLNPYMTHTSGLLIDSTDIQEEIAHIRDLPHVAGVWTCGDALVVALHRLTMNSPTTDVVHAVGGCLLLISPTAPYVALQFVLGAHHPYLLNEATDMSPIQATLAEQYAHNDLSGMVQTMCNYLQIPDPDFPGLGETLASYPVHHPQIRASVAGV